MPPWNFDVIAPAGALRSTARDMISYASAQSGWVPVIDEQTIYDPNDRDDKLLLDLKGTMSEAEL